MNIIIITTVIQVISLHRERQFPASSNQRHVTITVILMSTLFVVCNSAFYGFLFSILLGLRPNRKTFTVFIAVFGTLLPILNSALNPVIIISRSRGLRGKFVDTIRRWKRTIRGSGITSRNRISTVMEKSGIAETCFVE